MSTLQISKDLSLPLEAAEKVFAILAKRGSGKTYTGKVMAEEMVNAGAQVCVIDPLGVWWGLRTSLDGQNEGLPIAVLGGSHADLPLTREMGKAVARFVAESRTSVILDLSEFDPNVAVAFIADFTSELYRANREPLHLFIDEADEFLPQTAPSKEAHRCLVAMNRAFRRGRQRGINGTFMTQRPAVLSKDILNQIDILMPMRFSGPQDFKAIEGWVDRYASAEQKKALRESLPSLPVGTAWVYSPTDPEIFKKVQIRTLKTFDSSASPKIGKSIAQPDVVAAIDLSSLKKALDESLAQAEANDVKALQTKVAKLQKELAQKAQQKAEVKIERIEVPVIEDAKIDELKALADSMMAQARDLIDCAEQIMATIARAQVPVAAVPPQKPANGIKGAVVVSKTIPPKVRRVDFESGDDEEFTLIAGEEKILYAVASRYPMKFTRAQIGELSGYSYKGGTFSNYFGRLKKYDLLVEENGEVQATMMGLALAAVDAPAPPTTHQEMMAMWRNALQHGPAKMLEALAGQYPNYLDREYLGELSGYTASGGTFSNYLGMLRRNGLIEENRNRGVRAASMLFPELEPA